MGDVSRSRRRRALLLALRRSVHLWRQGFPADMVTAVPAELDIDAMIARFRERAAAVRRRGLPPVEGAERKMILDQMKLDYQDFAMLGDAAGSIEDGILTLRVDLRPPAEAGPGS